MTRKQKGPPLRDGRVITHHQSFEQRKEKFKQFHVLASELPYLVNYEAVRDTLLLTIDVPHIVVAFLKTYYESPSRE